MMSAEKFRRYEAEIEERIERRGRLALRKQGEIGGTLRDIRGIKRRDRNANVSARSNELRENAETALSCT